MDGADYIKLLGIIGGILASLTGIAKLMLNHYYKKEAELVAHKESAHKRTMKDINASLGELKVTMNDHAQKMTEFRISLEKSYFRYEAQTDSIKSLAENFKEFGKEFKSDMGIVRSVVLKLGQEIILIKGTRTPPKT